MEYLSIENQNKLVSAKKNQERNSKYNIEWNLISSNLMTSKIPGKTEMKDHILSTLL